MAAGPQLPRPGTNYGPCVEACDHQDCAEIRLIADAGCVYCHKPVGYESRWFVVTSGPPPSYAHAGCHWDEVEKRQETGDTA